MSTVGEGIEWIHVRNEEAGAFAAAAEAHQTGRLAVCAGRCGPGNTHLIQGLDDAHRSGLRAGDGLDAALGVGYGAFGCFSWGVSV
jgi:hypothetical protein